ncbi:HVA22-like protein a [Trifolium medium]|uniref:HVA22-like protein a n=1 Tax=Trifolium medium TaxID=97028 RepID=A0A392MM69_9FABA|nr:HVA22-like protein a [Trifolium medium]
MFSERSQPERAWQPFWVKKKRGKQVIRMKKHTMGTILVNTDACHNSKEKKFFFGGLVRDAKFDVKSSYCEQENYKSNEGDDNDMAYIAEVKGIHKVLDFCKDKYDNIMLVSDNLNAIRNLNKVDQDGKDIAQPTINQILSLKRHFRNIILCYAPRELNEAADYLANLAKELQEAKRKLDPPADEELLKRLKDDADGRWFKREELST